MGGFESFLTRKGICKDTTECEGLLKVLVPFMFASISVLFLGVPTLHKKNQELVEEVLTESTNINPAVPVFFKKVLNMAELSLV